MGFSSVLVDGRVDREGKGRKEEEAPGITVTGARSLELDPPISVSDRPPPIIVEFHAIGRTSLMFHFD